ncbi:MAG: TonB-dependent receptor [Bacteroidales bacterium]|nr:MAG: TonB-dependent receptor [Bacteroidales bacterium]
MNTINMKYIASTLTFILLILSVNVNLFGQDDKLNKEVQVVRPYEPSISDAFKINLLPKIDDTLKQVPNLSYNLIQRPYSVNFLVTPISSAKMLMEPMSDLYNTYVKFGIGNGISPLLEVYYNNGRSKEFNYGGWFQNHSSMGKVKLYNGKRVDSNFGRTEMNIFGKKILNKSTISASAGFNRHKVTYYGYDYGNIDANPDTTPKAQHFNQIHADLEYYSTHTDSSHLNLAFKTGVNHLSDKFDMQETLLRLSFRMDKFVRDEHFGGELSINHYMKSANLDSANNTIVSLSPWINLYGKQWRAYAGTRLIIDANSTGNQSAFYPIGSLSYDVISHYLIPYIEINGYLEENSYTKISAENPWVMSGKRVHNTSHKLNLTGGIKGNLSTKVSYLFYASYSIIDSMYFFVNTNLNSTNPLYNRFTVESDNAERTRLLGEITIAPSSKINIFFRAQYDKYKLKELAKPWHTPDFIALASIRYNLRDKIIVTLDMFATGQRYVKESNDAIKSLEGITDINLGIEYQYTKRLSAFVNLNNITSSKYNVFYLYPMYRFNVKAGLTYSF